MTNSPPPPLVAAQLGDAVYKPAKVAYDIINDAYYFTEFVSVSAVRLVSSRGC